MPDRRETPGVRLTVDLLGPPRVTVDGEERSRPRGAKTWALLAVLARSEVPLARTRLAELLFAEADDPLAALRWTASELRRLLGAAEAVAGDPLVLDLPPGARVDVDLVVRGDWAEVLELPGLGRPFLEGVNPDTGAAFELWLDGERRRIEAATEAVLHEAASTMLARGEPDRAVEWAERLVGINPYEENYHALLIRALVVAGRTVEADARVEAATRLLREELGVEPTRALAQAARVPEVAVRASPASFAPSSTPARPRWMRACWMPASRPCEASPPGRALRARRRSASPPKPIWRWGSVSSTPRGERTRKR